MIQIRSFPNDLLPAPQNRGWFLQAHAPLTGLLSERTAAQLVRDRDDLRLLQRRWWGPQAIPRIRFAGFQFTATDAPLSWKMNRSQVDAIDQSWLRIVQENGNDLQQVRCIFEPSGEKCPHWPFREPPGSTKLPLKSAFTAAKKRQSTHGGGG